MPAAAAKEPARPVIPKEVIDAPDTWLFAMDLDETRIAEEWAEKHLPEKEKSKRFTNLIDLRMLHEDSVVIPLVRRPGSSKRLTLLETFKAQDGERLSVETDLDKLLDEMQMCGLIYCKEHWDASASRYGGKLRQSSFMEQLGIVISPAMPKLLDVASRKNGEFASELVMRWL